jgi:hypothetical protein
VAQAVARLLCKHKALSSNPSPTKKQTKQNQKPLTSPPIEAALHTEHLPRATRVPAHATIRS